MKTTQHKNKRSQEEKKKMALRIAVLVMAGMMLVGAITPILYYAIL